MKPFLQRFGEWLLGRLAERSTYIGFSLLVACTSRHLPDSILNVIEWWGPFIASGLIAASTTPRPQ